MSHRQILSKGAKICISNDEYTIERLISRGGTSLIYEAIRPYCQGNPEEELEVSNVKRVILKELAPFDVPFYRDEFGIHFDVEDISEMEDLFMNEIQNISNIQKYNTRLNQIPEMDAFGKYQGTMYIAMNHIKGDLLSHYIYQKKFSQRQLITLFKEILMIVQELHQMEKTYLHLDLKPLNFIVGGLGTVYLFDFGSSLVKEGTWVKNYTERYSAPEVIYNQMRKIGPASDIYSLGVMLCEILTGKAPSFEQILLADGRYYQPEKYEEDYNPILARMLNPEVDFRYQNTEEVLAEFPA